MMWTHQQIERSAGAHGDRHAHLDGLATGDDLRPQLHAIYQHLYIHAIAADIRTWWLPRGRCDMTKGRFEAGTRVGAYPLLGGGGGAVRIIATTRWNRVITSRHAAHAVRARPCCLHGRSLPR